MVGPRVLVYGDSNSWGYPPDGTGRRMAKDLRWPGVFAAETGAEVIEECLPGRTTDLADPEMMGAAMSGAALLPAVLKSHQPVDLVLIMLGTNDLKTRFARSGDEIAAALIALARLVSETGGKAADWDDATPPATGLIAPPAPGARIADPCWERFPEWRDGAAKAQAANAAVMRLAGAAGIPCLDAARFAQGAETDPIHLSHGTHVALGRAVADWARATFQLPWN